MKLNAIEIVEDACIVMGVALSLDQLETIFGIVLLSIQIGLILFKGVSLIYKYIKNKDLKGAIDQANKTASDIKELMDKHDKDDKQ